MPETLTAPVLRALGFATGVSVDILDEQTIGRIPELKKTRNLKTGQMLVISSPHGHRMVIRYGRQPLAIVVAGPFGRPGENLQGVPEIDVLSEERLEQALHEAIVALSRIAEEQRKRMELASQLEVICSAVKTLASDLDLESMLLRIVDLAQHMTGARYAAIALPDASGEIETFVSLGFDSELTQRISHPPRGLGVLGVLLKDAHPIRTMDLATHPASIGFPANHPHMTTFLGVPIVARDNVLGSIYLADTRFGPAFTDEDTWLVQILADHAGVAITNARMFQHVSSDERRLREICGQVPEAIVITETNPECVILANRTT